MIKISKVKTVKESDNIRMQAAQFYAEELLFAGEFSTKKEALSSAKRACTNLDPAAKYFSCNISYGDSKETCGYLWYSTKDQGAVIEALFINKKYRRKGIAEHVLSLLEDEMRIQGKDFICLYVFRHNEAARRLYEKNGYTLDKSFSDGKAFSCLVMKKELKISKD